MAYFYLYIMTIRLRPILLTIFIALSSLASAQAYSNSYEFQLGLEALNKGNDNMAYNLLSLETTKHPDNAEAYYWLGVIYEKYNLNANAADSFKRALRYGRSKRIIALSNCCLAGLMLLVDNTSGALDLLNSAVKIDDGYDALNDRATFFMKKKKDLPAAEKDFLSALAKAKKAKVPDATKWFLFALGEIKYRQHDYNAAIDYAKKAIAVGPIDNELDRPYNLLFNAAVKADRPTDAADAIIDLIKNDAPEFDYLYSSVVDSLPFDKCDAIIDILDAKTPQPSKTNPSDKSHDSFLRISAEMERKRSNYKAAREKLNKMSNKLPLEIAWTYIEERDFDKAEKALRDDYTSEDDKMAAALLHNLILSFKGRFSEYISASERALDEKPDSAEVYYEIATASTFASVHDLDKARRYIDIARLLKPDDLSYLQVSAYVAFHSSDTALTRSEAESILKLSDADDYRRRAKAYAFLGDSKNVDLCVDGVLKEHCPNANRYRYDLVNCAASYAILGDSAKALDFISRAVDAGFNNFTILEQEAEFQPLADLPDFKRLVNSIKLKCNLYLSNND